MSLFELAGYNGDKVSNTSDIVQGTRCYMDWDGNSRIAAEISDAMHTGAWKSVIQLVLTCYELDNSSSPESMFLILKLV